MTAAETTAAEAPGTDLRRITGRMWADIAVLLVLAALGVLGFEPSFGGYGFLIAGLGGLALGAATGILAAVFRLGAITTTLGAVVLYFLFGTALAVPTQALAVVLPTLQSLASIAVGTVFGWSDLVTLATPVGAPQYIAVVPYFAAWFVALLSTTLATRWLSARPRTAWRFGVALIAPVALYLAGVLLGTDEPYQAGIRGVVFGLLALVWLGWRRRPEVVAQGSTARLRNRKLAGTAVVAAGAVVLGTGAGFLLAPANDDRFVLREEIQPPFDPLDYPSPLSGFRHYTKQVTDDVLFTVAGLQPGDRVRLATLDAFTGKLWNVTDPASDASGSGSFELVGRAFPEPTLITPVERDGVTFTIGDYDDVWLPSVGYPTSLTFSAGDAAAKTDDLRYNPATGTAVLTSGVREGDVYTIDAEQQKTFTPGDLQDAQIAPVQLPTVDGSPDIVTVKAQEFAGTTTSPIAQLEAIRLALINNGYLSHGRASDTVPSRAGHGADRITDLFERTQMVGDQEQYASAFALMARSLGYPARVVMGFAPDVVEGGAPVEVTGDDVTAWVEVAFTDVGWVSFDPTPDETDIPQDQVPKPQSEPQPQVRQPPRNENQDDTLLSPVELDSTKDDDSDAGFVLPGWAIAVGLSVLIPAAIVFIPLLVIGALKTRRARRRRGTGPGHDRVAGAWDELLDQYSELGYDVPAKLTRASIAERLDAQLPQAVGLAGLATATDEAVFSGRDIDDAQSEHAWTEALAAVEVTRAAVTRVRRILSRYRVRSARDWVSHVTRPRQLPRESDRE